MVTFILSTIHDIM